MMPYERYVRRPGGMDEAQHALDFFAAGGVIDR
jgi:hypothetical protein